MVMVAVVAVVAQGALDLATAAAAIVLVPVAYWFSYVRRHARNTGVKVALAAGLLVALGAFLRRVGGAQTVDEARAPLASLFVWVQVLHAFDVPRRRDLAFSVVSSVILVAEAASLSFSTGFLALLVPWAALATVWLFATQRPVGLPLDRPRFLRRGAERSVVRRGIAIGRGGAGIAGVVAVAVSGVFVALPRLPGTYVRLPPFSLRHAVSVPSFDGSVVNPSLPSAMGDGVVDFSPVAYPGFGGRVDLRARGRLSDRLVMLVRSPQAALWRGQVYDTFDGTTWNESNHSTRTIGQDVDRAFAVPQTEDTAPEFASAFADPRTLVTTFYVQSQQPNILFAAFAPQRVYFPTAQLSIGAGTSLRSPILLDEGLVYSVVSKVPVLGPDALREATGQAPPDVSRRYTQLPGDLPVRDVALARRITAGESTIYGKVMAVQTWLRRHTRYDLGVPRDPPGVDAVDEFLFERRRGFCEHIASAMAILLRAVGIPTRFVTGFGPGERNPLTGYFEVRESDAHAWVEVRYPGVGWVPYDPTFGVPPADGGDAWFVAPDVIRSIGRWVGHVAPRPIKAAASAAGHGIAIVARVAVAAWMWLVVACAIAGGLAFAAGRRRRRRSHPPPGAAAAFVTLNEVMERRGLRRPAQQTPSEFLRAIGARGYDADLVEDAARIVRVFERDRFSAERAPEEDVDDALAAAGRLRAGLREAVRAR
jgi:transglutaminase-like putative cysteine protease